MAKLIFERAIHIDPNTGEFSSYWEDRFPLELLAEEYRDSGSVFFAASYMNDPSMLEGNVLKTEWLHPFLPDELIAARQESGISKGIRYVGLDPTFGGEGGDPDFTAMGVMERIGNFGYLLDFHYLRVTVEKQAQIMEDWMDLHGPDYVRLEETSSRGYVYTSLTNTINNNTGSKYPIEVKKPQGAKDKGGKKLRLLAMAARFESGQIKVPGVREPDGSIIIDPRWEAFLSQWRNFPAGHDDILDALYWAQAEVFTAVTPGAVSKSPDVVVSADDPNNKTDEEIVVPQRDSRGKVRRPIGARRERIRIRFRENRW